MTFRIKKGCGAHSEPAKEGEEARMYEAGDLIETEKDLCALFPGKFERVEVFPNKPEPTPEPEPEEQEEKEEDTPAKEERHPLGRDVTDSFPEAKEEDLKVFADGGAYSVVEPDEDNKPLNEKPLKKRSVSTFIKKYLGS